MKHLKTTSFAILSVILMFASCSIEKRVHMPGYHAKWNKSNQSSDRQETISNNNETNTKLNQIESASEKENIRVKTSLKQDIFDKNIFESLESSFAPEKTDKKTVKLLENKPDVTTTQKNVVFDGIAKNTVNKRDSSSKTKIGYSYKNKLKDLKANSSSNDEEGIGAITVIGWIVLILGALILYFVSIIVGAILMLLGLVFVIAGRKKGGASSKSDTKSDNSKYVDVVYLKNGSIIRGMIIEQTPNVSLKIQTKDGSVFVYKMEEVEKMAKELENK